MQKETEIEQVALMPVERSYDVRAKQIIAFNECRKAGGDLDDALDAAYKVALRYTPAPADKGQGEPVAWRGLNAYGDVVTEWIDGIPPERMTDLCGNAASFHRIELAYAEQPAPVAVVPRDTCPNCQGSTYGCATCIPDFTPGNGNRARRRAIAIKALSFEVQRITPVEPAPTAYDGFDNGID